MNRNNRTFRNNALVGAIVAALALTTAGTATAQSTSTFTLSSTWTQTLALNNFLHSISNSQSLLGNVNAPISGSNVFYTGNGDGQPSTVSNNTISATALGNAALPNVSSSSLYGNTIDLSLLGSSGGDSGLGILSGQTVDAHTVTATVSNAGVATALTNHKTGAVTESGNRISASSTVNEASSHIDGQLPSAAFAGATGQPRGTVVLYGPAAAPSSVIIRNAGFGGGIAADLSIANAQANRNTTGSLASVSDSNISVGDTSNGTVSAAFSNGGNRISAGFTGNSSDNAIHATGGAPSYDGSAAVTNAQSNLLSPGSSAVSNSSITTTVDGTNTFKGTLSQSNNAIDASTQGSAASNSIVFTDGISIAGDSSLHGLGLGTANTTGSIVTNGIGDLVVLSVQTNLNVAAYSAGITGSGVTAQVNALSDANVTVTVSDNQVQASSGGNRSSNAARASGASFDAFASVGNQQANYATPVTAKVTAPLVGAYMTGAANSLGTATVSGNSVGASANGNQATTAVDLAGTAFNSGSGAVTTTDVSTVAAPLTDGHLDTGGAGISAANFQGNYSTLGAATISAGVTDSRVGTYYTGGITGGATTVGDNAVSANAGGNDAATSINLGGGNAQFTASLANGQFNTSPNSATVSNGLLGIYMNNGSVANTTLSANGNRFGADAFGNNSTNSLATDFTNATLGDAATTWVNPSSKMAVNVTTGAGSNTSFAALSLLSNQSNNANVTGRLSNDQTGVYIGENGGGNVTNTSITVSGNSGNVSAVANNVSNTLSPGVGNLATTSGSAAQIATLGNLQQDVGSTVNASFTESASALGAFFAAATGNASGMQATVSDNRINVFAGGNLATNGMAVTGGNYAPSPLLGGINGLSVLGDNTTAAYALQSLQISSGGSRSAAISNGTIGAVALGHVLNSPLTVSGNQVGADARDNYASDALSMQGFSTLTTTAASQIKQYSTATVSSSISGSNIAAGSLGDYVRGSDVTVSGNGLRATAISDTAFNTFSVDAGQLGGNSIGLPIDSTLRGAVILTTTFEGDTLADYGLSTDQISYADTTASIIGGQIGGGAAGNFDGGSLTVTGNTQTALAQSNSSATTLGLSGTGITASAALFNFQYAVIGNASATVTSDNAFAAFVGGALGTPTATPVTVSANTLIAQAGLNTASNVLNIDATSTINGTGLSGSGASSDSDSFSNYQGAVADAALYNFQQSNSGATATASPGLVGIEVANGGIGNAGGLSALTVSGNHVAAQASANDAGNAISLTGASNISATTALDNDQYNLGFIAGSAINASASNARVGIYDGTGAPINTAGLHVSGNSVTASASGNSSNNSITVQPTALNEGSAEATLTEAKKYSSQNIYIGTALASNALINNQDNWVAINATVSNSTIGVNPAAATASALLNSTATVDGNSAMASATGNRASNSIMLASLPTGVASSALTSTQYNTAAISATASNIQIGVTAGGVSTTPVTVSGNTISATAVGNSATNHIGIGN